MQRIAIGWVILFAIPCLAESETPKVPLIEGDRIKIALNEFVGIPHTYGTEIKRISTKGGDRIQLKTPHMVVQAKEIMVRCPNEKGADFWILEIAEEPNMMNIQSASGPADEWLPWPRTVRGKK
jgi:hypothetical protein